MLHHDTPIYNTNDGDIRTSHEDIANSGLIVVIPQLILGHSLKITPMYAIIIKPITKGTLSLSPRKRCDSPLVSLITSGEAHKFRKASLIWIRG